MAQTFTPAIVHKDAAEDGIVVGTCDGGTEKSDTNESPDLVTDHFVKRVTELTLASFSRFPRGPFPARLVCILGFVAVISTFPQISGYTAEESCYKLRNTEKRLPRMIRAILFLALLLPCLNVSASNFPRPAELEPAVQFWIKVYTEISTSQGFIHDDETLSVIYETIEIPRLATRTERQRVINGARQRVASALDTLAKGKRTGLNATETAVLDAWPEGASNKSFTRAAQNVRFQLGQSDRFKAGLVRSGQWKPHIREVLAQYQLPPELEVLPHVESSFNPDAYSKVAAAGMWQFMPATARQFMRVDHVVDERMDPFAATEGAARLLKRNYEITGTWPLALTGYNHGVAGMARASRTMGTRDIAVIVQKYKGAAFGFASRNFYTSFLAALEIDSNPERYFGPVELDTPTPYEVITLEDYIPAKALASSAGITLDQLRLHNSALMDTVWSGEKHIPKGYPLRMPAAELNQSLEYSVAAIPGGARYIDQKPDVMHRIARGDSLSIIARRYGTSVSQIKSLNGLRSDRIRAGKTLILPGHAQSEVGSVSLARRAALTGDSFEYVIQKGDSLWSIARRFKVSQKELVAWNRISPDKYLQPGQKLKIANAG